MQAWRRVQLVGGALAAWALTTTAMAQNPELGLTGEVEAGTQQGAAAQGGWSQAAPPSPAPQPAAGEEAMEEAALGGSDHDQVVGRLGVGFFGVMDLPVMTCGAMAPADCANPGDASVDAPTIGARYWLDAGLGIEAAIGFNLSSPEAQTDTVMPGVAGPMRLLRTDEPSVFALGLHGGLPLVFAHSGHFVFEFVPQLNVGFASGDQDIVAAGAETTWDVSGFMLELGGRVGAEIHFGFIDIPQLSLQATVGLGLRIESRSAENTNTLGATTTHEQSLTRIATSVDGQPWDIFTGSITAIYYL